MARRRAIAIAAVAGVLIAVLVLELVARTQPPPVFIGLLPFDPDLGYRMPLSHHGLDYDERGRFEYRLNSLGFRGPELPDEGQAMVPGLTRILFVGDSFLTPSLRDEELIQTTCTRELSRRGLEAEAYTLCCNDYGTAQELLLLEQYGPRVQPDAVVLEVFPHNDLANNTLELAGLVETSAGDYIRPYFVPHGEDLEQTWAQPSRAFLRRHLRCFALLDRALIERAKGGGLFAWYAPWPLTQLGMAERLKRGSAPAESRELYREHAPGHPWERAWEVTGALVRAFADRARGLGARVLVLVIPSIQQVEVNAITYCIEAQIEQARGAAPLAPIDPNLPERRLADVGRKAGIEMRFLLEPLRAAALSGKTSYGNDGHLNGRGSTLAGRVVADWVAGGNEFPSSGIDAPLSAPVSLLPTDEGAPRRFDLEGEGKPLFLGSGWFPYVEAETGRLVWASAVQSTMLLPLRAGDRLVVAGKLPAHAPLSTLTLAISSQRRVVEDLHPGEPFEAQLKVRDPGCTGCLLPVSLSFSRGFRPLDTWREFGAFLTGVELR
jgi:hypothetical protein